MPEQPSPHTARLPGFDPRQIFHDAPVFKPGEANLVVGGETKQVLGRMAACFLKFREKGGDWYIRGVSVIAPPRAAWDVSDEEVRELVVRGLQDVEGEAIPPEGQARLGRMVKIHRCAHLDINEVAAAVDKAGERQVILVPEAAKYRDSQIELKWSLGRSGSLLAEDTWVPHMVKLATASTERAAPHGSIIVFSAGEDYLVKPENLAALNAVDLLYPIIVGRDGDEKLAHALSTQIPRWVALAAGGRAQLAYEELEQAGLEPNLKRQVLLQIAARAGDRDRVLELLRQFATQVTDQPAEMLARYGRLANTHGEKEMARQFFDAAIEGLNEQMWLEVTLMNATSLGVANLVDRSWARLSDLFPESVILRENREFRLLKACDAQAPGASPVSRAGFEHFHQHLADSLAPNTVVDYDALMTAIRQQWPADTALAALCVSLHALEAQSLQAAVAYAAEAAQNSDQEPQAVRVLLGALRRMFLLELGGEVGAEPFKVALLVILRFLSRHPDEASLRAQVASALAVESAGEYGLKVLVSLTLDVLAQGVQQAAPPPQVEAASQEECQAFFAKAYPWMSQQPAIEPGVMRLPAEIVGDNARGLLTVMTKLLQHAVRHHEGQDDLDFLEKVGAALCLTHPYAPEYSADLDGLRLVAVKLWLHGKPQRARDYAEQMLTLGHDSPQRQRLAWGNFADVYQRARSPVDALIGLTCAALTNAAIEPADIFQEAYTLLRVARDLHFFELARSALQACRRLYDVVGAGERGHERLAGIELTLDVAQHRVLNMEQLLALLERTRLHCEQVMRGTDELHPPAAQFLQIAGTIERAGVQLPPQAEALREELGRRLGPETGALLRAISAPIPDIQDVLWLHNRLGAATNSEDAPADQHTVVLAAERTLQERAPDISPEGAALAIELLAERGIELAAAPAPLELNWPATLARNLSQAGLGVLLLATDSDDELVAVIAENGAIRVVRPPRKERTFEARLNAWAADYPYRYGSIEREEGNGEFYLSMGDFEFPLPATDKVLVVAQPLLQQVPPNLMLLDENFAGETKAIGFAPSLTWFDDARQRPANTSTGRLAWISCSQQAEAYGALDMIYAGLQPVFGRHGFQTDTSGRVPADVRGSKIAVVTAHGQLTADKRYIHSITDDDGLMESAVSLARALADVELAILFVCSGGRVDPHPLANTSVSLPKMLLDRGCRTVIASPWPLATVVPGNWLERFLEAWDEGDTALEATFKANQFTRARLGPEPGLCLALTVYGDVLLTR